MATAVVGRIRFVTSMPMNPLLWELNESPAPAREKRRDLSFSSPEKISANNVFIKEGGKKNAILSTFRSPLHAYKKAIEAWHLHLFNKKFL